MNKPEINATHSEMEMLLPWYVNETLDGDERRTVEGHLGECEQCQAAVEELRQVAEAVGREPTTPLVPAPPVEEFMKSIDADHVPSEKGGWFSIRYAAAASLVAVALLLIMNPRSTNDELFYTVTDAGSGTTVSYVFTIDYTGDDVALAREAVRGAVPTAELSRSRDADRLVVSMPSRTITELETFAASLQQLEGVERVELIGVQLPLE